MARLRRPLFFGLCVATTTLLSLPLSAQSLVQGEIVATRGGVSLTLAELDAGVRKVPPEMRKGYMNDATRMARMIDNLLTGKQVAVEARSEGLDKDPEVAADLALAQNEILAREFLDRQVPDAANQAAVEQLAEQTYRANPERFLAEPIWDISYLLASTDGRHEDEAKALAESLLARARAGEDLETLIKDATAAQSSPTPPAGGSIEGADLVKMDAAFVSAVKSIKNPGEWSEPVRTRFGYHIARLDRYVPATPRPFDDVKDDLVAELRGKSQQTARTAFIRQFSEQPTTLNDELIATLRERYAGLPAADAAASTAPGDAQAD